MRIPLRRRSRLSLLLAAALASTTGCYREVASTQPMTWTCEPEANQPAYPNLQSVRLRYLSAPSYSELEAADHLCDRLTASGKRVIPVHFFVFGDPWDGMRGYNINAIDGIPYTYPPAAFPYNTSFPAGTWGSSEEVGGPGPRQ